MCKRITDDYRAGRGQLYDRTHGRGNASDAGTDSVLDGIYTGTKSALRQIHELVIQHINGFGPCEVVPTNGYVSLRRATQFAMIGPGTRMRLELGLNNRALRGDSRP